MIFKMRLYLSINRIMDNYCPKVYPWVTRVFPWFMEVYEYIRMFDHHYQNPQFDEINAIHIWIPTYDLSVSILPGQRVT